ncbi:MAG: pyridoxamine 5'-phosphate oxidase family protein, partial [Dehalococcoidia bacterium]|nr:pyridoxamine 5'-phosphate oxidase family protein [Dehalococcoidia bacterium]
MQRELGYDECIAMLEAHRFGRLGIRDADGVYIVPISYAFAADALYAHAPPGHKLQLMRLWPHVAFQVDEIDDSAHYRSVLVQAHFEELTDEASRHD